MKAKLHKMVSGYILSLNGDIDDPYAIVNEELAKDHEWYRLSLRNCQAIERGYDLDELAKKYSENIYYKLEADEEFSGEPLGVLHGFRDGFQKALEILGDKKFSEEDMNNTMNWIMNEYFEFHEQPTTARREHYIQSLQQTEWDVEIVEECLDKNCDGINKKGECITTGKPKLDKEGCLILKKL